MRLQRVCNEGYNGEGGGADDTRNYKVAEVKGAEEGQSEAEDDHGETEERGEDGGYGSDVSHFILLCLGGVVPSVCAKSKA